MGYDLIFLTPPVEPSWEEVLESLGEEDATSDDSPDGQMWATVLESAREMLGEITEYRSARHYELDHEATGIQVSLYAGSAGIAVPYWYSGADAKRIVRMIYDLGRIVERNTGLAGYDPQVGLPLAEAVARPDLAEKAFDQGAGSSA